MLRLFFSIIFGLMLLASPCFAQEDNVGKATSALESVLSNLKQSTEKLSVDNNQLAAKDNAIKGQILQLQTQLGQMQDQGNVLEKGADKLQEKNPRRAEQIENLEAENYDLDNRTQKAESSIKVIQESLDAGYQEEQKLLLHLKGMQDGPALTPSVLSPEDQVKAHYQKEKLQLMKMIYESQERQEASHKAILEFQKNTPLLPAASALAHQQLLKEQIQDLEAQIAAYPPEKSSANLGSTHQWNDAELHQMESGLKDLEQNYAQLKALMGQMDKKAHATQLTASQHAEGEKLQNSIDDLNRQAEGLRANLDDLRSQMVDLDKRKSHLEVMIQQLP